MLYQVATGLLSADEISSPLRSVFSGQKNIQILLDEVTGIDSGQRLVHLSRGDVPYDYLILATGIQYNYFGHDEWRQFASGLESLDDADIIRGKILRAFERAEEMASIEHAEPESSRHRRGDGCTQTPTRPGGSWWNRTCRCVIIKRYLPSVTPLISSLRFETYLASNRVRRC